MTPARVLLNVDCGEADGEPEALFALAHLVNVACGGHAGDAASMRLACERAERSGTRVGAHPSFPDREGFGRRALELDPDTLAASVGSQCASLRAAASSVGIAVTHLKFHGALYHRVEADPALAERLVDVAVAVLGQVEVLGAASGALGPACRSKGLRFLREGFADRGVDATGKLLPRSHPDALLLSADAVERRCRTLLETGGLETVCVHSDTPGAVAAASSVRAILDDWNRR